MWIMWRGWLSTIFIYLGCNNRTQYAEIQQPQYDKNVEVMSPSLRLIQRLAESNNTLCLAGDSIDFQFYDALRNNLIRQQSLLRLHKLQGNLTNQIIQNISISETRQIPVNFTNVGLSPYHIYWMTMDHIIETAVTMLMAVHIRLLLGTLKRMVGVRVSREAFFVVSLFILIYTRTYIHSLLL